MMTSALLAWPACKLAASRSLPPFNNEFQKSSILMGIGTRVIAVSEEVGRSMQKRGIPTSRLDVVFKRNDRIRSVRGRTGPSVVSTRLRSSLWVACTRARVFRICLPLRHGLQEKRAARLYMSATVHNAMNMPKW